MGLLLSKFLRPTKVVTSIGNVDRSRTLLSEGAVTTAETSESYVHRVRNIRARLAALEATDPQTGWAAAPQTLLQAVVARLEPGSPAADVTSLCNLRLVCQRWNAVADGALSRLRLSGFTTDAQLALLAGTFSGVTSLAASSAVYIGDMGLRSLTALSRLQELRLPDCVQITITGLESVTQRLTQLTALDISACSTTSLSPLLPLAPSLTCLTAADCRRIPASGFGFQALSKLTRLAELNLDGTQLSSAAQLAGLNQLSRLSVCGCGRLASFGALQKLTQLRELALADTHVGALNINAAASAVVPNLPSSLTSLSLVFSEARWGTAASTVERWGRRLISLSVGGVHNGQLALLGRLAGLRQLTLSPLTLNQPSLAGLRGLGAMTALRIISGEVADVDCDGLRFCARLRSLEWGWNSLPDDQLCRIAQLTSLTQLKLDGSSEMTPAGLASLRPLQQLQVLGLDGCSRLDLSIIFREARHYRHLQRLAAANVATADLDEGSNFGLLAGLPHLQGLSVTAGDAMSEGVLCSVAVLTGLTSLAVVSAQQLSPAVLASIARLTRLSSLSLPGSSSLKEAHLRPLGTLIALTFLDLSRCKGVSGESFGAALRPLRRLQTLDLQQTSAGNAGLAALRQGRMTSLTSLRLEYCTTVTDDGIAMLRGFKALRTLRVPRPGAGRVTEAGKERLTESIPHLLINTGMR